jgi:PKD repeat protein
MPSPEAHFYCETKDVSKYWWNFGDGCSSIERDPVHTYTAEGVYNVTLKVEDAMGCQDSVTIYNAINIGDYGFIVFPNAFTPNTSVPNGGAYTIDERRLDIFYPVSKNVDEYKLEIFNQWGAKIFVSNDVLVGWDGYIDDKCALQGTYVYKATGKYKNGREFKVSGSFMLVR